MKTYELISPSGETWITLAKSRAKAINNFTFRLAEAGMFLLKARQWAADAKEVAVCVNR